MGWRRGVRRVLSSRRPATLPPRSYGMAFDMEATAPGASGGSGTYLAVERCSGTLVVVQRTGPALRDEGL